VAADVVAAADAEAVVFLVVAAECPAVAASLAAAGATEAAAIAVAPAARPRYRAPPDSHRR
jgi:hypothetical protein